MDISRASDGTYLFFDNDPSGSLDKKSCECSFILNHDQAVSLSTFLRTYRAETYIMTMDAGEGFYPFMPFLGCLGPFPVSCEILKTPGALSDPWLWYRFDLRFTYAKYTPTQSPVSPSTPALHAEGHLGFNISSMEDVIALAAPENLFEAAPEIARSVTFDEQIDPYYVDRGNTADQAVTSMSLKMNFSNAYYLMGQLTGSFGRTATQNIMVPANYFIFGEYYGDNQTFSVKLIQDTVELTHEEYNLFSTDLTWWKAS
jgi:hypothetical protein